MGQQVIMRFSTVTLSTAYKILSSKITNHKDFDILMYRWDFDEFANADGWPHARLRKLLLYLREDPNLKLGNEFVMDLFVEEALSQRGLFVEDRDLQTLRRAVERDGFIVTAEGKLQRMLPEALDLPAADDEIHRLLDQHRLITAKGHLDQGISNHSDGNWAAANNNSERS